MRIIYKAYKYGFLLPAFIFLTILFGFFCFLTSLKNPKLASKLWAVSWAKTVIFFTPSRINIIGADHISHQQSYVIVANHSSFYDILVLYGYLNIDLLWVMKKELRKVPIIGITSALMGHIFIDRSNGRAAAAALEKTKKQLKNGTSTVFFPEGTRNNSPQLLPFKKGAFKVSLDLQLPILPITLVGTNKILPRDTFNLSPGTIDLIIHRPIHTKNIKHQDIKTLVEKTKQCIQEPLRTTKNTHLELDGI